MLVRHGRARAGLKLKLTLKEVIFRFLVAIARGSDAREIKIFSRLLLSKAGAAAAARDRV